jgi:hypothetical protein
MSAPVEELDDTSTDSETVKDAAFPHEHSGINLDPTHEYAMLANQHGQQVQIHFDRDDMITAIRQRIEEGPGSLLALRNVDTGDQFHFFSDITLAQTYSKARHDEMLAEAKAAQDKAREEAAAANRRVIVPNQRHRN